MTAPLSAAEIAKAVTSHKLSAQEVTEAALARIERARSCPQFLHRRHRRSRPRQGARGRCRDAAGKAVGPLAGVPFAVKNLFDVDGLADARRLEDQPRRTRRPRATPR